MQATQTTAQAKTEPKYIQCFVCGEPVGRKGSLPSIKVGAGKYKHTKCKAKGQS